MLAYLDEDLERPALYLKSRETLIRASGLLCFSRHWYSPALWAHYADNLKGMCLGFDIPDDKSAQAVQYCDGPLSKEEHHSWRGFLHQRVHGVPSPWRAGQAQGGKACHTRLMALNDWKILRQIPVLFARQGMMLSKYWDSTRRRERMQLLLRIRSERDMLMLPCEACQVMSAVDAVKNVPGDMAELGVANGASSMMISSRAPHRVMHLFDTFEGLPEPSSNDSKRFRKQQYRCSLDQVQSYVKGDNFRFHKGLFPDSAAELSDLRFAFVHLDADLYQGTLAGLEWFYSRMNPGAILVCHDFDTSAGVNQAFTEFFADKPEPYFDLVGSQCMFVTA